MEVDISNTLLHHDNMVDILLLLPAKSLALFRFVSKSWYKMIRDPLFTNLYLVRSKEYDSRTHIKSGKYLIENCESYGFVHALYDFQEAAVKIEEPIFSTRDGKSEQQWVWGSCNGLICIQIEDDEAKPLYIWNPTTMEYREIPSKEKHPLSRGSVYGFGYLLNKYELLRITSLDDQHSYRSAVNVYSLRKNSWRTLRDIPYGVCGGAGVLSNGAFHWIAITSDGTTRTHGQCYYSVIAYNLKTERCSEIALPDSVMAQIASVRVQEFRGELCILDESNVWVMNEYGVRDSWTKLLNVYDETGSQAQMRRPFRTTESGYIVTKCSDGNIYFYDPEKKSESQLDLGQNVFELFYCPRTIVALDTI